MAEKKETTKKSTRTTSKKVVTEPKKDAIQETPGIDLVPHKSYQFISNGKGGMQKDRIYKVTGVVAASLLKSDLGKVME
jgi:hypothetical protein